MHRKRVLAEHPKLTLTGLYNVLEELRKGVQPDALDEADRRIFDDGQVLILKELHERLDVEVADAYGWAADLPDEEILSRLVALNKERAAEEAKGEVRWLRPEYQIPRFGTPKEKAELDLTGGEMRVAAPASTEKRNFPSNEIEQTAAVMAVLASATQPLDAGAVAATFKQGRKAMLKKVEAVLAALNNTGYLDSRDKGRTFLLRLRLRFLPRAAGEGDHAKHGGGASDAPYCAPLPAFGGTPPALQGENQDQSPTHSYHAHDDSHATVRKGKIEERFGSTHAAEPTRSVSAGRRAGNLRGPAGGERAPRSGED